uniref:Uncharacterized protein n=1 Tax=Streptomyces hawaiiensis TaxID=67305 RepID=A0A5B9BIW8_9ACTN|nr:hypothetical protein [Streptomyces hawaiiensis]
MGGRDPLGEFPVVALGRFWQGGEAAYGIGNVVISGQAATIFSSRVVSFGRRFSGSVSRRRLAWRGVVTERSPSARPWLRSRTRRFALRV